MDSKGRAFPCQAGCRIVGLTKRWQSKPLFDVFLAIDIGVSNKKFHK